MGYFALRCFSPEVGKYIVIGLNVFVAIMGVIHWAYAGVIGQYLTSSQQMMLLNDQLKSSYNPPIAYFSISGILQIGVSVLAILLTLDILGKENKLRWARLIIILMVLQFAFNFFIAVYTSMLATNFAVSLKPFLDVTSEYVNSLTGFRKDYFTSIRTIVNFTTAMAILTWILVIPGICVLIAALSDQLVNEKSANDMGKLILIQKNPSNPQKNPNTVQAQQNQLFHPQVQTDALNITNQILVQ